MLPVEARSLLWKRVVGGSGIFVRIVVMSVAGVVEFGMKLGCANLLGLLAGAAGLSIGLLSLGFRRLG